MSLICTEFHLQLRDDFLENSWCYITTVKLYFLNFLLLGHFCLFISEIEEPLKYVVSRANPPFNQTDEINQHSGLLLILGENK